MAKVNKILLVFILTIAVIWTAFWQILQSKKFASYASSKITTFIEGYISTNVSFSKIDFVMLPPGIKINEIQIDKFLIPDSAVNVSAQIGEAAIYFNIVDLFARKLSIKDISIKDGKVEVSNVFADNIKTLSINKFEKHEIKNIFTPLVSEKVQAILNESSGDLPDLSFNAIKNWMSESLPLVLRRTSFRNVDLYVDDNYLYLKELETTFYGKFLEFIVDIENIPIQNFFIEAEKPIDQLSLKVNYAREGLKILNFEFRENLNFLSMNGEVKGSLNKPSECMLNTKGEIRADLKSLFRKLPVTELVEAKEGILHLTFKTAGKIKNIQASADLQLNNFDTHFVRGDNARASVYMDSEKIQLREFEYSKGSEQVKLSERAELYDFKTKAILPSPIKVQAKKLHTHSFLHVLREKLWPMQAFVSGDVEITYGGSNFNFLLKEGGKVESFKLLFDENKKNPVLDFHTITFKRANFKLNIDELSVGISAQASFPNSEFDIDGSVNSEGVNFISRQMNVDLYELGKYGGLVIKGKGPITLKVSGKFKTEIDVLLEGELSDAKFLGFNLGDAKTQIKISLFQSLLKINYLTGAYGTTKYDVRGDVNLKEKVSLLLKGSFSDARYKDLLFILENLTSDLIFLPPDLPGKIESTFTVSGPANLDELKVEGRIDGSNLNYYNEIFSKANAKFMYSQSELSLFDVYLQKNEGHLRGEFKTHIRTKDLFYTANIENIILSGLNIYQSLPFDIDGTLAGQSSGQRKSGKLTSQLSLGLKNSFVANQRVKDSFLKVQLKDDLAIIDADIFSGDLQFKSHLALNQEPNDNDKKSYADVYLNIADVNLILGFISAHNVSDRKSSGFLKGKIKSNFNLKDLWRLDCAVQINDLKFSRENVVIDPGNSVIKIDVRNGKIQTWNLGLSGKNLEFSSFGSGDFSKQYSINTLLSLDSSLLELIDERFVNSEGEVKVKSLIEGSKVSLNSYVELLSKNFNLSFQGLPAPLENVDAKISLNNGHLFIESLRGIFGTGKLLGTGDAIIKFPWPQFNFQFKLENSLLSIFPRSSFMATGEGSMTGSSPPYLLSGNFIIGKGTIFDELQDLNSSGVETVSNRFLPKVNTQEAKDPIQFNLTIDNINDLYIRNSLGELRMAGSLKLLGTTKKPKLGGQLTMLPGSGRFYFKSSDFILSRGNVSFFSNEDNINPEVNFAGKSKISEYDVELKILGRAKNFVMDLDSEPPLSQEDIFSLLALGFTGEVSSGLKDKERESLTGLGIGSILFDKFRVNQGLNSSLGLKVSVSPDFIEAQDSLLSGRTGDSVGATSSLRTATKFKIQKKISDALDVSVSSTMAGSSGQKQEMNLNYDLNKNVSVIGVYEVRSEEDGEDSQNNSSMGADFKLKWSFK